MVTHQLQVERRTGKVRRSQTDVLPLCHATKQVAVGGSVFTARRYTSAVYPVVVCPSVTRRHRTKTAKSRITQTPYDSQGTLSWGQRSRRNSNGVTPNRGTEQRWGMFKRRFSTNISL